MTDAELIQMKVDVAHYIALEFDPRREEYITWLKNWIRVQHEKYRDAIRRRKDVLANPREIRRHPAQLVAEPMTDFEMLEWYWSEGLFCGDIGTECPELFFEEAWIKASEYFGGYHDYIFEEFSQEYFGEAFNEAFRAVMPKELHHVLEG